MDHKMQRVLAGKPEVSMITLCRLGLLLICAVPITAQALPPAAQPQNCTIEGHVVSLSGEPLNKVSMSLTVVPSGPPYPTETTTYTASTSADGKFVFHDVPSGRYRLAASRTGYLSGYYGAKEPQMLWNELRLDPGQEMRDIVLRLTPRAVIFGRVVDDDGDPVANAMVAVQNWIYSDGKRRLNAVAHASSQADGSFVIGDLRAGRYLVKALPQTSSGSGGIKEDADKNHHESNLPTFFPSAVDPATAVPVDVATGAEVRGIEIRIRHGRTYEIRGRVRNTSVLPDPPGLVINLRPKGGDWSSDGPRTVGLPLRSNFFQFKDIAPGSYIIEARALTTSKDSAGGATRTEVLVGQIDLTVSDADVETVVLPLNTGIEVAGYIQLTGTHAAPKSHPTIQFMDASGGNSYDTDSATAAGDGSFRVRGLRARPYRIRIFDVPEGSYVKTVRFDGQDMPGKMLDLTSGHGGEMQIMVSLNAAEVSGVVRDEKGDTVSAVVVQLFDETRILAATLTDQSGAFELKNLAPGEFEVFAWESTAAGVTQNAEFRKHFEPVVVKLAEKSHQNLELKLIPKNSIEAEAARLQ
jgi:hypothetical protein